MNPIRRRYYLSKVEVMNFERFVLVERMDGKGTRVAKRTWSPESESSLWVYCSWCIFSMVGFNRKGRRVRVEGSGRLAVLRGWIRILLPDRIRDNLKRYSFTALTAPKLFSHSSLHHHSYIAFFITNFLHRYRCPSTSLQ
jgi:hypothetical protein